MATRFWFAGGLGGGGTYRFYVHDGNVVHVRAERQAIDLGGRHAILDLQRALVEQQHRVGGDYQQNGHELERWWYDSYYIYIVFILQF